MEGQGGEGFLRSGEAAEGPPCDRVRVLSLGGPPDAASGPLRNRRPEGWLLLEKPVVLHVPQRQAAFWRLR